MDTFFDSAPMLTQSLLYSYLCNHDWTAMLQYFDSNSLSFIDESHGIFLYSYDDLTHYLHQRPILFPKYAQLDSKLHITKMTDSFCILAGTLEAHEENNISSSNFLCFYISAVFICTAHSLKAVHIHLSGPASMDECNTAFPVEQFQIERKRTQIIAELNDDILFEYDIKEDILEKFLPVRVSSPHRKLQFQNFVRDLLPQIEIHPDDSAALFQKVDSLIKACAIESSCQVDLRIKNKENDYSWKRIIIKTILGSQKKVAKLIGKVADITSEKLLLTQSRTDSLTGAYNRFYLKDMVSQYIREKTEALYYACLMIDIDYFKNLNDRLGHIEGDRILIDLVKILKSNYRSTDLVGRLGGDEFLIFMKDLHSHDIIIEKTKKLLLSIRSYSMDRNFFPPITISIGIAADNRPSVTFQEIYHRADIALYHAKNEGRNRYCFYKSGMQYPK